MKKAVPAHKVTMRDIILGGQDGLVNVFGIALGLFTAHASTRVILVAGLAAGFSEAVSMGAVAYTSARADIEVAYQKTVAQLLFSSFIVMISALLGSLAPLVPFLFFSADYAIIAAIIISGIILFSLGALSVRTNAGEKIRSGLELVLIGMLSAFAGFAIGLILKV